MPASDARNASIQPGSDRVGNLPGVGHFSVRRRILYTGKKLFAHFGYDDTSIADIALAMDIPQADLLRYYGDKASLLAAVFDDEWKTINKRLEDIILTSLDAHEATLAIFAAMTHILDKDRDLAKLLLFEGHRPRAESREVEVAEGYKDFIDLLMRLVMRGQKDGTYHPAFHPRVITSLLISAIEGLNRDWLLTERQHGVTPYSGAQLISVFDALVSGLKP